MDLLKSLTERAVIYANLLHQVFASCTAPGGLKFRKIGPVQTSNYIDMSKVIQVKLYSTICCSIKPNLVYLANKNGLIHWRTKA